MRIGRCGRKGRYAQLPWRRWPQPKTLVLPLAQNRVDSSTDQVTASTLFTQQHEMRILRTSYSGLCIEPPVLGAEESAFQVRGTSPRFIPDSLGCDRFGWY